MFKTRIALSFLVLTFSTATNVQADIIWSYFSTDGPSNVVTGTLTTSGTPAQLTGPAADFDLLSIDEVTVNGDTLDAAGDWHSAVVPPFTSIVSGGIRWDGTSSYTLRDNFLYAAASPNHIQVAAADSRTWTFVRYDATYGSHAGFEPTTTTVSPISIPEPSTVVLLASGLAGLVGLAWHSRRRHAKQ